MRILFSVIIAVFFIKVYNFNKDPVKQKFDTYVASAYELEPLGIPAPILIYAGINDPIKIKQILQSDSSLYFRDLQTWVKSLPIDKAKEVLRYQIWYQEYLKSKPDPVYTMGIPVIEVTHKVKKGEIKKIKSKSKSTPKKVKEKKYYKAYDKYHGYSYFEIAMWYLRPAEGFRSKPYDDGKYKSIGYGFNLHPDNVKLAKSLGISIKKVNKEQAYKLKVAYIDTYILPKLKSHPVYSKESANQWAARIMKAYNTGSLELGSCCGGKKNKCGRGIHTSRRTLELNLFYGRITKKDIEDAKKFSTKF